MKYIFWNIGDKDDAAIGKALAALIEYQNPDVLLLAESNVSDMFIWENSQMKLVHEIEKQVFSLRKKMKLYTKKTQNFIITPASSYGNGEILTCLIESDEKFYLLFGCHFVSKVFVKDEIKRLSKFSGYRNFIESTEDYYEKLFFKTNKILEGSIVFGDFNENPFETPFLVLSGLLSLDIKESFPRKLSKVKFFINPTMSLLGNYTFSNSGKHIAPGTFYYDNKDLEIPSEFFWNAIDGMFFRPSLKNAFEGGEPLEVISEICDKDDKVLHKLFDYERYQINVDIYSDHLPIKFSFKI